MKKGKNRIHAQITDEADEALEAVVLAHRISKTTVIEELAVRYHKQLIAALRAETDARILGFTKARRKPLKASGNDSPKD